MGTTERTIRLTPQDREAIAAIREQYGLTSDSEAIRFALHTMWREILIQRNPRHSLYKERPFHPAP
jgi:hypothetical protein